MLAECPPTLQHSLGRLRRVGCEEVANAGHAFLGSKDVGGLLLNGLLACDIAEFNTVALGLQSGEELRITRIGHICHPILHPESGLPRKGYGIGIVYRRVAGRGLRGAAINRRVGAHVRVVVAKP